MNILITNDDGFDAPGLSALISVATAIGEPIVVAPRQAHSMGSHAISRSGHISVEKDGAADTIPRFICEGTPADCVRIALKFLDIPAIDVVLSGINRGANAGVDIYYSGTVAAAREGAILGVPGVALSQLIRPGWTDNWQPVIPRAQQALRHILDDHEFGRRVSLTNVNLPDLRNDEALKGIKHCPMALAAHPLRYEADSDGARNRARFFDRDVHAGTDYHYMLDGWITITRLRLDGTADD